MSGLEHLGYVEPTSFVLGLGALRKRGIGPRGLVFLALESSGAIHVAVPSKADTVSSLKVGDKLALEWPLPGRFYHFDSVHRLRDHFYLFNGDRRLAQTGTMFEVAALVTDFLKSERADNVFFGCTPHQPGSWLVGGEDKVALHEHGFVEVVPVPTGLLARRVVDHRLWHLPYQRIVDTGRIDRWDPVYASPLGNLLMLERRIIDGRLVLTCARGLVEVDVSALPSVVERERVKVAGGGGHTFGVVGRVDQAAFAVTRGKVEPWGLDGIRPATLMGADAGTLESLGRSLPSA
jgi:hypothetical protein